MTCPRSSTECDRGESEGCLQAVAPGFIGLTQWAGSLEPHQAKAEAIIVYMCPYVSEEPESIAHTGCSKQPIICFPFYSQL